MLVAFDGKRLVSALVDVPQSHVMPMLLPAANVSDRKPLHEGRQLAVTFWPQQEMPMIGHERIAQIRMGVSSRVSCSTRLNAWKSPVVSNSCIRATPRLRTWNTIPPGATRAVLGMPEERNRLCLFCQYRTCPVFSPPFFLPVFSLPVFSLCPVFSPVFSPLPFFLPRFSLPSGVDAKPNETDLLLQPLFVGKAEHDVVTSRPRVECPAAVVHAVGTNRIEQASRTFPAIVQRPLGVEIVRNAADVLRRQRVQVVGIAVMIRMIGGQREAKLTQNFPRVSAIFGFKAGCKAGMSMPVSNLPIRRPKSLCATAETNEAVSFSGSRISGIILRSSWSNCSKALLRREPVGWRAATTALSNCSLQRPEHRPN